MTVRVERKFFVDAKPAAVWSYLEDPSNRARAISVVDRFDIEGETVIWQLELPLPGLRQTLAVRTRTIDKQPPEFVSFEGRSSMFDVNGAHRIEKTGTGTTVHNQFEVTGHMPGVEHFFKRQFDGEIDNLETALITFLEEQ